MASGTISLGTQGYLEGRIQWSSSSNGSSANTSNVTATIQAHRTNEYTTLGTWTGNLNIGGTNKTFSWYGSISSSWVTLLSFTVTIKHNDNGTGSCAISGRVNGPTGTSMDGTYVSGSKTVTLDTIPRYPSASQSLNSRTETSIIMNWSSDSTIDYAWYSTNNGSNWTGVNVADGKSGTYTISGLTANTTYQIKTRLRRKDSQLTKDTGAISITTYNYPYCNSMPSFTIGNQVTLKFYNPLGRTITFYIIGNGTQISNSWEISGTSYTGISATSSQNQLYATIPNSKSATYQVKVVYGSSTITKTGGTYSINTSSCTPEISTLTYQDTNSTVTAITNNNQQIVQNQSTVQFSSSGLSVKNSATISSCTLSVNAVNYNLSVSGSSASVSNVTINSASNVTAQLTLTDSRGLTATKSVTVTMLAWSLPNAIITMERQDNYYTSTTINVNASYSSLDNKNSITITYRSKKTSDNTYGSYTTIQNNTNVTDNFDNTYDWNVQFKIADVFGTTTYNLLLAKGTPIVFFDRIKSSMGVNCFPADDNSLELLGENIYNALFFNSGDTLTLDGLTLSGMLSGGSEDVNFSIILPKSMKNVTPSLTELKSNIRVSAGGYLFGSYVSGGYNVLTDTTLTVAINKINDYMLRVIITKSSAFSTTNNTPLAVTLDNAIISFT